MACYDGEDAVMIDTAPPPTILSPLDIDYTKSFFANYPPRPFRLWDLPRELRDAIYDYALIEETNFKLSNRAPSPPIEDSSERDSTPRPEDALDEAQEEPEPAPPCMQAVVQHRAATSILLAGKALKQEYEERAQHGMKVVLKDSERFAFQKFSLPTQAAKIQTFELHLILFCHSCNAMSHFDEKTCHAALELNQHQIWINKLLPDLTNLRSLAIHAYISHDRYRSDSKQKIPCERVVLNKFQQLRCLANAKNLCLYKYDYNGYPDLDGPKAVVWEWSARDGVKTPEEEKSAAPVPTSEGKGELIERIEDAALSA